MQPASTIMKRSWPALLVGAAFIAGSQFGGAFSPATAGAAQPEPRVPVTSPPFNASEQRNRTIVELEQINRRLQAIETKLNSGINVKVTDMPAVVVKDQGNK